MKLPLLLYLIYCSYVCFGARVATKLKGYIKSRGEPIIDKLHITTNVVNRFAESTVVSWVHNKFPQVHNASFYVLLPESAYITGFSMTINGTQFTSYIADINTVQSYNKQSNVGGATISTLDSNEFNIRVTLEPFVTTTFKLHYEEMLERRNGMYEIIANIFPRQLVEEIIVDTTIQEDEKIDFINQPFLRSGNNVSRSAVVAANALMNKRDHTAVINFSPPLMEQFKLACGGLRTQDSFAAQYVVQYDVERSSSNQVLANDEYFISFFTPPTTAKQLPRHLVFVLDQSGSMGSENRMIHLKAALRVIIPKLNPEDTFNIVTFDSDVRLINIHTGALNVVNVPVAQAELIAADEATPVNIQKALDIIDKIDSNSATNIYNGLLAGYQLATVVENAFKNKYQSIIVLLTDGEPNEGISDHNQLVRAFKNANQISVPVFTISLGSGAIRTLNQALAYDNGGFEFFVADGAEAKTQLMDFFQRISSLLVKNLTYSNISGITAKSASTLVFNGTEVVVAGQGGHWKVSKNSFAISGQTSAGNVVFKPSVKVPSHKLDKLWAFLTVKSIVSQLNIRHDPALNALGLNISLTYSLVTPFTSLVIVQPNGNNLIDLKSAYNGTRPTVDPHKFCNYVAWPLSTTRKPSTTTVSTIVTTARPRATAKSTSFQTTANPVIIPIPTTTSRTTTTPFTTTTISTTTTTTAQPTTTPIDQCQQRPDPYKSCPRRMIGYYFDGTDCKIFRGCDTIFTTPQECESNCMRKTEDCMKMMDSGPCTNYEIKWYYDMSSGECKQFHYGGCGGNENRFATRGECDNLCNIGKCQLAMDAGSCVSFQSMWYYSQSNGDCEPFDYGGCGGNLNRFISKNNCEKACIIRSN